MNPFKRKEDFTKGLVSVKTMDGFYRWVSEEVTKFFDRLLLTPTVKNPNLGVCRTCGDRPYFMNQLVDFENENCCFMKNHEVEPFLGVLELEEKDSTKDLLKNLEYDLWIQGEIDL